MSIQLKKSVDYQPRLERIFLQTKQDLALIIPNCIIEHIGSSAIPQAISKGDLDICVIVPTDTQLEDIVQILKIQGYTEKTNTLRTAELCMLLSPRDDLDLALQVIQQGSEFENFIYFRDVLRKNLELVDEYNQLKAQSAQLSHEMYRQAKAEFIHQILIRYHH